MALTYYDILGVAENATDAQIEAAFRDRAREIHPDKISSASPYLQKVAAEAFKDLSEAKSVLLDRSERANYDSSLAHMRGSTATTPPRTPKASAGPKQARRQNSKPDSAPGPASTEASHQAPPAPTTRTQQHSFWKPTDTKFASVVLVAGGLGCILFLTGIATNVISIYPGLILISLSLALLCWRHGKRPGTDAKVLALSVMLFVVAALLFFGWIESPSDGLKTTSATNAESRSSVRVCENAARSSAL